MNNRLDELKRERARVVGKLFIARCAICLLTVLLTVQFVFDRPITSTLAVVLVVVVPAALFCYDKLAAKIASGKK